jgi:hypothetical protein
VDVKGALEAVPLAPGARGELALEVVDAVLPPNARPFRATARDGRLRVTADTGRKLPRLRAGVDVLAQLLAGTLSPARAEEMGLVESSEGAAEIAEAWWRARPAFVYSFNLF